MSSSGVDLDKVLAALSDGSGGIKTNSDSLLGLAKEVNTVLGEFEKTIKMMDNMNVLPLLVRAVGKKYEVDVDTPLNSSRGIQPASDYHKLVFEQLNGMDTNAIAELLLKGAGPDKNDKDIQKETKK